MPKSKVSIQRDLDWLEELANKNSVKFIKDKCQVLHLGRKNPLQWYRLKMHWLWSSSAGKDTEVLVDSKLNTSLLCALADKKAYSIQDCINSNKANISRGVFIPLRSVVLRCHVQYCPQFYPSWYKEDIDQTEWVQQKARNMISSWGNCPLKISHGTCACPARRREHFITAFQYLWGGSQDEGYRPLHVCVTRAWAGVLTVNLNYSVILQLILLLFNFNLCMCKAKLFLWGGQKTWQSLEFLSHNFFLQKDLPSQNTVAFLLTSSRPEVFPSFSISFSQQPS